MTKWWICGVALAVVVVSVAVMWGVVQKEPAVSSVPSAKAAKATVDEAEPFGILGVWDGRLALFRGDERPDTVYDVWVASLPADEQQRLENGIAAPDRAAFLALLQEYTG